MRLLSCDLGFSTPIASVVVRVNRTFPDFRALLTSFLPQPAGNLIQTGDSDMASDFRLKEQLPELTNSIVETYSSVGTINHLDHCPLPSYEEIIASVHDLTEILYPGYRRREGPAG